MSAVEELVAAAQRYVELRLPACQLAVAGDGELIAFETVGSAGNENRFLIWSCTKAIVSGVVWQLIGEGKLDIHRTVASYIPEFATRGKESVTVEQCLLHTAGFPLAPLGPTNWFTSETRRAAFARWRLNWEPGTQYEYHPLSAYWVLAELIIEVTGNDHRDEVRTRISKPLGLDSLQLGVPEHEQGDVVDIAVVGIRATEEEHVAAGIPYTGPPATPPEAALLMNPPPARAVGIPGAGVIATAADVAMYYQALLKNPGGLWDRDVLADGTGVVPNDFFDEAKALPANRSRGLVIRGDHPGAHRMMHFGPGTSPRAFGHDGAGGQIAWADPETGLSFCFVTNGMEANGVQEVLRCQELATLAAKCA